MLCSIARMTAVMLVGAVLAEAAGAQVQDVPFVGVVVQDTVKVRAGAGRAFYDVGELKKGAVVQVDDVIFGWNKIVSPPGVYSYISKMYVDAKGNGEVGYVNTDRVEVKAGSSQGPGVSYRGQVQLNKGDSVEIIAEEGSFYKITPPKGAYVYLQPGSVRRADPARLAAAQQNPGEEPAAQPETATEPAASEAEAAAAEPQTEPQPTLREAMTSQPPAPEPIELPPAADDAGAAAAVAPATETANAETPATVDGEGGAATDTGDTGAATAAVDAGAAEPRGESANADGAGETATLSKGMPGEAMQSAAVSQPLQALEQRMIPLFMQPLEKQPIDEMIQAYEAIQRQSLPTIDRQIVSLRLAVLKRNRELAQVLRQIQASTDETTQITLPDAAAAPQPQPAVAGAAVSYDAVGKLLASSVYDGIHLPRMFRVVDPASGRTILWVEPGGPVDAKQYLGKVVGLVGPQQYDPALKFNVLNVKQIDVLEAQATP